jgi:SM-20-related protein
MAKTVADANVDGEPDRARGFAMLNVAPIENAAVLTEPYQHLFASGVIPLELAATLLADAPRIRASGSISPSRLTYGAAFQALIDDLESPLFRRTVEHKFQLDLGGLTTTISVRGQLRRAADGYIHTDLEDKVVSVLLYLNPGWPDSAGALRVLRSRNIEDYALEIPPEFGNILIFRRSECSWHGHLPYEGARLSLQFNWLRSSRRARQYWRHRLNFLKRLSGSEF